MPSQKSHEVIRVKVTAPSLIHPIACGCQLSRRPAAARRRQVAGAVATGTRPPLPIIPRYVRMYVCTQSLE